MGTDQQLKYRLVEFISEQHFVFFNENLKNFDSKIVCKMARILDVGAMYIPFYL